VIKKLKEEQQRKLALLGDQVRQYPFPVSQNPTNYFQYAFVWFSNEE
jgi:hypothetical protein